MKKILLLLSAIVSLNNLCEAQKGFFNVSMPCMPTLNGSYQDDGVSRGGYYLGEAYLGPGVNRLATFKSNVGSGTGWTLVDKNNKTLATNPSAVDTYIPPTTGWVAASGVGCVPVITGNAGITCTKKADFATGQANLEFPTGTPTYGPIEYLAEGENAGFLTFSFSEATSGNTYRIGVGDGSAFAKALDYGITTIKIIPRGICTFGRIDTLKFNVTRGILEYYTVDKDGDGWGAIPTSINDIVQAYGPKAPYLVTNFFDCDDNDKNIGKTVWYLDTDGDLLPGDTTISCTDPSQPGFLYRKSTDPYFKSLCKDAYDNDAAIGCYDDTKTFSFALPNPYDSVSGDGIVGVNAKVFKPTQTNLANSRPGMEFDLTEGSSDKRVATMDQYGNISVVGPGETMIAGFQRELLGPISYRAKTYTRKLTVDGYIVSKATLPTATVVYNTSTPTINWPTIAGARTYCIKIYSDASLTKLLYSKCGLKDTSIKLNINTLGNIVNARMESIFDYYYTVAGENASGTGPFASPAGSFKVNNVVTAAEQESNNTSFSIFPNPSNGTFNISSSTELGNVTVFNSLGLVVYQHTTSAKQLNIQLPSKEAGVYFVKVGNKMTKLVKE